MNQSQALTADVADRQALSSASELRFRGTTRCAGLFLFLPLLAQLRLDQLVELAGYPGSDMVPADAAVLSLLTLKLLDKERHSHIDDFNFDAALALFAGLNVLPKKSFASDYGYRTQRSQQQQLLAGWMQGLAPLLLPQAQAFCLDFHPIPYRGEEAVLENHYVPCRGQASPSVLSFFATDHENGVFCYADANVTRDEQAQQAMQFVQFWNDLTGHDPQWLYFDSKLTTYPELSQLNERGVYFVTIRRRGASLIRRLEQRPQSDWTSTVIDVPKRRHKNVRYLEQSIRLRGYEGPVRQVAVQGLGRETPTLFLTNHPDVSAREILMNYARRNGIEDRLGTAVNFFHLDCLCSEVRLNVDLDVALTVIAHGCYCWLARRLKGFEKAQPKQLYRKFVETSGQVRLTADEKLEVTFDRRCHNPILKEAALDQGCPPIPWLKNYRLVFNYR